MDNCMHAVDQLHTNLLGDSAPIMCTFFDLPHKHPLTTERMATQIRLLAYILLI